MFRSLSLLAISLSIFVCAGNSSGEEVVLGEDHGLLTGIPGEGPLRGKDLREWLANKKNHETLTVSVVEGLDAASANIFIPEDNPLTRAKIELGRQLYFDTRLSSDNTISCASCHNPAEGYGAHTQFGVGVDGQKGGRNSPISYNRLFSKAQFWDGRADSLEAQAVGPIANPIEMGNTHEKCVADLAAMPVYKRQFEKIFDDGVTIDNVGKAIAAFERILVTGPTPYDYYQPIARFKKAFADDLEDDEDLQEELKELEETAAKHAMSESALRGMELFAKKAQCAVCHAGANFTDEQYHNLGVGMEAEKPDLGRFEVTKVEKDKGAFKTPTLRNVALSAPYMHDGSQKTLEEVVEWYDKGGHKNDWLSDKVKPLKLTDQEKKDLVAFMKEGLAGSFPKVEEGRLPANAPKKKPADVAKAEMKKDEAKPEEKKPEPKADKEEPKKEASEEKVADKPDSKEMKDAPVPAPIVEKKDPEAPKKPGFLGTKLDGTKLPSCVVKAVFEGSAADSAKVKAGDVIVGLNDSEVATYDDLRKLVAQMHAGDEVTIKVKRGDETKSFTATLGEKPAE